MTGNKQTDDFNGQKWSQFACPQKAPAMKNADIGTSNTRRKQIILRWMAV